MKEDTPATDIRAKDLRSNTKALKSCLDDLPKDFKPKTTLDIRYGLGGWAREIRHKFKKCSIIGFEWDYTTFSNSYKDSNCIVHNRKWDNRIRNIQTELLLADFNNMTALQSKILNAILEICNPLFVIFTDIACSKLHLNYKSYGLLEADLNEYWKSFPLKDFELVNFHRAQYWASTSLWVNKRKSPQRGGL